MNYYELLYETENTKLLATIRNNLKHLNLLSVTVWNHENYKLSATAKSYKIRKYLLDIARSLIMRYRIKL